MKRIIFFLFCVLIVLSGTNAAPIKNLKEYRKLRDKKLVQPRAIIFNNDGNDACSFPASEAFSIEAFLLKRTLPLKGSDVKAISYCTIASGFGHFTHNTKAGEFIAGQNPDAPDIKNIAPDMVAMGTDPLHEVCKAAKGMDMEVFWSNRMNDTHDWRQRPEKRVVHWTDLKENHPEYLMAPKAQVVPHARWSSINFAFKEVRDLCVRYFTEVCENYDVDGIELDFFRHLHLFKTVAYAEKVKPEELDMLTDMVRQIRTMTEQVGMKKGKPILVSVRIPDSKEYATEVGIDIERWMKEGLFDILIGSDYFRLNPWKYLVDLGHQNHVKVYAGLSDPRVESEHPMMKRFSNEVFLARAAAAWEAGVDGIYMFNEYNAHSPYLSEIGNAKKLQGKDKRYFVTYVNANPNHYLEDGKRYHRLPRVSPTTPFELGKNPASLDIEMGNEKSAGNIRLILYAKDYEPTGVEVKVNNVKAEFEKAGDNLYVYRIPPKAVKPGNNQIHFSNKSSDKALLLDVAMDIKYE